MHPTSRILKTPTVTTAFLLMLFLLAGTAFAIDQPPQEPEQLRPWLVGHLVTDMEALGTFDGTTLAKVPGIVNALTDDQVALLAQYYFLTRSKTEQDAGIYSLQQQGYAEEQVNGAKAEVADLLTEMNDQTVACYDQFVSMPEPVQYLAQICYASVPGWCCHARCFVPDWYYDNGCYVGPCYNAAYAGIWGVPVYNAYYNHGSHFYGRYHNVANTVYASRSVNLAHRRADWFRHHGDWHQTLAHDRLLHRSATAGYRTPQPRIAAGAKNHIGKGTMAVHNPAARTGAKQHHPNANYKAVAQHQNPKARASYASAARSPKAQHKAGKAHANHVSAGRPKAQHKAAKPHTSAAHAHASRPAAHAAHPAAHAGHAKAHASHPAHAQPHPQPVAQAHSGHGKHK